MGLENLKGKHHVHNVSFNWGRKGMKETALKLPFVWEIKPRWLKSENFTPIVDHHHILSPINLINKTPLSNLSFLKMKISINLFWFLATKVIDYLNLENLIKDYGKESWRMKTYWENKDIIDFIKENTRI